MKNPILLFTFISSIFQSYCCIAQGDTITCRTYFDSIGQKDIYETVHEPPVPQIGTSKMFSLIGSKIQFNTCHIEHENSSIIVAFIVTEQGKITGKRILDSAEVPNMAHQLLSLIDELEWIPGKCNNVNVPVLYTLPFKVYLK